MGKLLKKNIFGFVACSLKWKNTMKEIDLITRNSKYCVTWTT